MKRLLLLFSVSALLSCTETPRNLVPQTPSEAPDYLCTWNLQCYRSNQDGPMKNRAEMVEENFFGDGPYQGWASLYPAIREDLFLVLDDSWDIPRDRNERDGNPYYGTVRLDTTRFPSFRGAPAERLKALSDRITGMGWKGLGGWICAEKARTSEEVPDQVYWRERLQEAQEAGIRYWKVDWGEEQWSGTWRKQLTEWGRTYAPGLVIEHAMNPEFIAFSDTYRTYDVENITAQTVTIDRVAQYLRYAPEAPAQGIINCEDEPYIAAALGCAIGIMRHPFAGALPSGRADIGFPESGRNLKCRLDEVVRGVRWHRIALPFGSDGVSFSVDSLRLEDGWIYAFDESWIWHEVGDTVRVSAPARVSRGMPLPQVGSTDPARPFVLASRYPHGAVAVATVGRSLGRKYVLQEVPVDIEIPALASPVGIFGRYERLTLHYPSPLGKVRVWAQDLAACEAVDITERVTVEGNQLTVPGSVIAQVGLTAASEGDVSDPGLVLSLERLSCHSAPEPDPSDLMSDTWVATDALGRQMPLPEAVGPVKEGRHFTGIFYITWHGPGNHNLPGPYTDVSKILEEDPSARLDGRHPLWKYGSYHWGEPEAGYFLSQDTWLMRRDLSMLQDAGIDVLILDVTNGVCYWDEWELLFATMEKMREEGNRTPQFTFWSYNNNPVKVVTELYERYYKTEKYKDLWFYWDDRPLLLYNADPSVDATGNFDRKKEDYPAEIFDFFTLRNMWWGYYCWGTDHEHAEEPRYVGTEDNWSFGYSMDDERVKRMSPEQLASKHEGKVEECAVTPAQHPLAMPGAHMGVGKSWTRENGEPALNQYDLPEGDLSGLGLYFQERWEDALAVDPPFIYLNDWNEWTAGKYNFGDTWFLGRENSSFAFVDQYNAEFNRTIQPMKGGYTDNYYMQMASNIRRYKGARPLPVNKGYRSVQVDGRFKDWDKVKVTYRDTRGDTAWRDADGYAGLHYTDSSGRNDIVLAKVALDRKGNVNFYVETAADITAPEGEDWMLLLLDTDQDASTGWSGYDYVVNREPGKLMAWSPDGWMPVADVPYAVSGNRLELSIPAAALKTDPSAGFDFKWADHSGALEDPMFLRGDAAPNRRFNYRFAWRGSSIRMRPAEAPVPQADGYWSLPPKPDEEDWLLEIKTLVKNDNL